MSKMNYFVKGFIARLEGDNEKAKAAKCWIKAESALNRQISSLKGETMDFEESVKDAQDNLEDARLNFGKVLDSKDRDEYINNLLKAKNKLTAAEKALKEHNAQLNFLEEEYVRLNAE